MVIESTRDVQLRLLAERRRELDRLASRVPPGYKDWSHNTAVEFKAAVMKAAKIRRNSTATMDQLNAAIGSLMPFWGET